jgi:predicted nucleotidyltransferase
MEGIPLCGFGRRTGDRRCGTLETELVYLVAGRSSSRLTQLLVDAANPARIILYGSHARGEASADSDIDIMVVETDVRDRVKEMVRLDRVVRSIGIPVDLLVVSKEKFDYWRDTPGNVYFEAAAEGRTLYEAT